MYFATPCSQKSCYKQIYEYIYSMQPEGKTDRKLCDVYKFSKKNQNHWILICTYCDLPSISETKLSPGLISVITSRFRVMTRPRSNLSVVLLSIGGMTFTQGLCTLNFSSFQEQLFASEVGSRIVYTVWLDVSSPTVATAERTPTGDGQVFFRHFGLPLKTSMSQAQVL
jgi:hypothetical protein